ncbi:MAG: primosomal replication protein N [Rhodocyclaceae bacterium]|nr:primosomal replication protein N [Rhodocyclaceae bacterium]
MTDGTPRNLLILDGQVIERGAVRYTPAGVPVIEFKLQHESEQIEAGSKRKVDCEMACVALGSLATLLSGMNAGSLCSATGFLAAKSLKNRSLVLHVTSIEFKEGINHGI